MSYHIVWCVDNGEDSGLVRASAGWFIILMIIIALLLLILLIACIVYRRRGDVYPGITSLRFRL